MAVRPVLLRVHWTEPPPGDWEGSATEFGLQAGRSELVPGEHLADGTVLFETQVECYEDSKERLRFRGPCVQGTPEEAFLYLSRRRVGDNAWLMRAKVMLTPLTREFLSALPENALLETEVSRFGHRDSGHVQEWRAV